jgi:hypothetical protein
MANQLVTRFDSCGVVELSKVPLSHGEVTGNKTMEAGSNVYSWLFGSGSGCEDTAVWP